MIETPKIAPIMIYLLKNVGRDIIVFVIRDRKSSDRFSITAIRGGSSCKVPCLHAPRAMHTNFVESDR